MIFVSTGGEKSKTAFETASYFLKNGIECIELSGGQFSQTYQRDLLSLARQVKLQVHNYFPPSAEPFVLNLASSDSIILGNSISHVKKAIQLASLLGRPVYSFHAGFRIDPSVKDLGVKLGQSDLTDRVVALEIFGDTVLHLSEFAMHEGVTLLIENNVLSKVNLGVFKEDPLLLTQPEEISRFIKSMPKNIGLLLDVAHLKVSAQTLNFDLIGAHEFLRDLIGAYHLSDNDGVEDTNCPIAENSWFWPYLKTNLDNYTLEVYGKSAEFLITQRKLVDSKLRDLIRQNNKAADVN